MVSPDLEIRLATPADLDAVVEIELETFASPWSRASLAAELEPDDTKMPLLALRADEPIGYALAWAVADEIHLVSIAVRERARRQGIARAMMDWILASLPARVASLMTLEVRASNTAAIRFYEAYNFKPVAMRPRYYDDKEDALVMIKPLGPAAD